MPQYFEVVKTEIAEVYLEPKYRFEIPRFQRNYAWEESNVQEFWDTIFCEDPVFLGTIIFNNQRKDADILEIIDGQQRYLTINILGAVIRDFCIEKHAEYNDEDFLTIARGVTKQLIGKEDPYNNSRFEFYLKPGDSIAQFFHDYIQDFDGPKRITDGTKAKRGTEEDRVKRAYLCFRTALDSAVDRVESVADKKSFLIDLVRRRLGKHFFVRIEIADEDLAYEIFETVNAKGVELNVADLVKNQIFRHVIGGDGVYEDKAKALWGDILEAVDSCGLSIKDFLSYYWSSKHEYVSERRLYRTIKDRLQDDSDRWTAFLEDLHRNAGLMKTIFTGDVSEISQLLQDQNEALRCFESLRILRNTKAKTWAILYLCLFRNLKHNDGSNLGMPLRMGSRWEIIAKFTFVYFQVMGYPGNWYFSLVCDFCRSIEEYSRLGMDSSAFASLFSEKLFVPFDSKLPKTLESFTDEFVTISYKSDQRSRVLIRYILSTIEQHLGGKYYEGFDENKVSIEHILPQTPNEWGLTKTEIRKHVNLIGNLILIGKRLNGAAGNRPFDEKLVEFANSQMHLIRQFTERVKSDQWDFGAIPGQRSFAPIDLRGKELAEIGFKIWVTDLRQNMGFAN